MNASDRVGLMWLRECAEQLRANAVAYVLAAPGGVGMRVAAKFCEAADILDRAADEWPGTVR